VNAREAALELLDHWSRSRALADELIDKHLDLTGLLPADRALAMELFYGCLRQKLALEFLLASLAPKAPRAMIANILKLGLYQLAFLRTPPHAAVNETVALAKRYASVAEARFVNALLRKASAIDLALALEKAEPWMRLSHPRWLWERWRERWGEPDTIALCEWNNQPPSTYIRINTFKASTKPADVAAEPTEHPLCWRVTNASGLFQGKSFVNGEFYIQDPSTLIAVDVLDPQPGESVLDMCAAPGGKTTYIAQKMENRGRIIAADSSNARLGLVAENCQRLGVEITATLACEGTRLDRCLRDQQFDRVLLDAPCSNTGVMRRRVDLRWRIEEREITRLAVLQEKLLRAAAGFAKPGGILVYSTCSLEDEENERVIERLRKSHPRFALETTRSTFPPRDNVDGAFVARFRNTNAA
jgi:16S rRNA (cytosine967-C5)-methyltransferase